jgi:hypothetical protein
MAAPFVENALTALAAGNNGDILRFGDGHGHHGRDRFFIR